MYLSHFRLNLKPFQVNTDKRFLYLSQKHEEALYRLRYGILDNRGVLVLTGDVGTGKTLLIRALVETLGPSVQTALITDPSLKGLDFFNFMAHAFGMGAESETKGDFLIDFGNFLDSLFEADQQALLIIDEAQNIDADQLEEIRILSNFERGNHRLNIFFVGQDEFNLLLADKRLRALKQRITTHYHIEPLSSEETGAYVQHRLKVAGCDRPLFTPEALDKIFGLTNGYPRLINIICDHCLLSAFVKRLHQIDPDIVEESAADLMHPHQFDETHGPPENRTQPAIAPQTDIQPATASMTPHGLPPSTAMDADLSVPPQPANALPTAFFRKSAYLLAAGVLLAALGWFSFQHLPYFDRQALQPSPELRPKNRTATDSKPVQSSRSIEPPGTPQMEPKNRPASTDSAAKMPTKQQVTSPAAVTPAQSAPPQVVPPMVRPEAIAAPNVDSSHDAPATTQPVSVEHPASTPSATLGKRTEEDIGPRLKAPEPDPTAEPSENTEAAELASNASPPATIPVAGETDEKPLLPAKIGQAEADAAQTATKPPETKTPSILAPVQIMPDQAPESDFDVSNLSPPATIPVTGETVEKPLLPQKIGQAEADAAQTATKPPETKTPSIMAPTEIRPDHAPESDFGEAPPPSVSPIDASTAETDVAPQELPDKPMPTATFAEPTVEEIETQDTESDPSAIIDFVIRKRSRQQSEQ